MGAPFPDMSIRRWVVINLTRPGDPPGIIAEGFVRLGVSNLHDDHGLMPTSIQQGCDIDQMKQNLSYAFQVLNYDAVNIVVIAHSKDKAHSLKNAQGGEFVCSRDDVVKAVEDIVERNSQPRANIFLVACGAPSMSESTQPSNKNVSLTPIGGFHSTAASKVWNEIARNMGLKVLPG